MDPFQAYLQYQKEVVEAKLKIINRMMRDEKSKPQLRTSKIDISWNVLKAAGKPLHVTDIIDIARKDYNVVLDRDSIVSGMIKKANAGKMFLRTAPNTFSALEDK